MAKRRQILKCDIRFVSLCRRGKNGFGVLYKDDDTIEFQCLTKEGEDDGTILSVVYAPGRPDADGHFADSEVVKEMCYTHSMNGLQIDIHHNGKALQKGDIYVAENFIIQKGDPRFENWKNADGTPAGDLTGGWAQLYKVDNETLREQYRSGEWNGVSLAGPAITREVMAASEDPNSHSTDDNDGDEDMKPEDIQKAMTGALKAAGFEPKPQSEPLTKADVAQTVVDVLEKALPALLGKSEDEPKPKAKTGGMRAPRLTDHTPDGFRKYGLQKAAFALAEELEKATDADEIAELTDQLEDVYKDMEESGLFENDDKEAGGRRSGRALRKSKKSGSDFTKDQLQNIQKADLELLQNCTTQDDLQGLADVDDELLKAVNGDDVDILETLNTGS